MRYVWLVILVVARYHACLVVHLGGRQESGVCGWSSWCSAEIRHVWVVISVVGRYHACLVVHLGGGGRNQGCVGGYLGRGQQESGVCGWSSRRWRLESGVCGCRRIGGGERAYSSVVGTDDGGYNIV